jgi:gas vesicle protein
MPIAIPGLDDIAAVYVLLFFAIDVIVAAGLFFVKRWARSYTIYWGVLGVLSIVPSILSGSFSAWFVPEVVTLISAIIIIGCGKDFPKKQKKDYPRKMKTTNFLIAILAITVLCASCSKKQTTAEKYAESVKTVSDAYSDVIKQTSEAYSEAAKSVSSDLADVTDAANAVAGLATALGSTTKSSSSSNVNWKKAMDDYEKFVDDYVSFMKKYKANPTDMSLLTEYASMAQKATTASDSISKVQSDLSGSDLVEFTKRYSKIAAKMASAL